MNVTTYLARRFMLGGAGAGASRFTGWIAIIGMTLGCLFLILSVAVLNGFEAQVTKKIIGFEGDLRITNLEKAQDIPSLIEVLRKQPGVKAVMPFMERKGLLTNRNGDSRMVSFKAVDFGSVSTFYDLGIHKGIEMEAGQTPIIIGRLLAARLNLEEGDPITVMSPIDSPWQLGFPRQYRTRVAAIFQVQVLDFDDRMVFLPLELGRKMFVRKKQLDGLDIRSNATENIVPVKNEIAAVLPPSSKIYTWAELHEGLFQAMKMERIGAMIILSLIVLVAAFNLTSTLVLVTYQKIREIGILRTIGATAGDIYMVLIKQGLMIGGAGALAGIAISLAIIGIQNHYGIFPLPEDIYFMDRVPMILRASDLIIIPGIALALIVLSSVVAARRAMMIQPKDAVHLEK